MFTGIIEELGEVVALDATRLTIRGPLVVSDAAPGASIAVNGVCLTVTELKDQEFAADVMQETLDRSGLGALRPGSPVNLERPMRPQDRLGGHLVQGHVDGVGHIRGRDVGDVVTVGVPAPLSRYIAEKGSVAVDGVSLTVVEARADAFTVALIPTTLELTTLGRKSTGDPVNIEVDVVAKYVVKYVERFMNAREGGLA